MAIGIAPPLYMRTCPPVLRTHTPGDAPWTPASGPRSVFRFSRGCKYKEQSATNVPLRSTGTEVRHAASSKRDGNEWALDVNAAPTAAAVWDEQFFELVFFLILMSNLRRPR